MKKIILMLAVGMLFCAFKVNAAENQFYSVVVTTTIGTTTPTGTGVQTPHINLPAVKIKKLTIANPAALAQTFTFYKNATSTTTMSIVYRYDVPATIGTYEVISPISNLISNADMINWPYLAVKSSSSSCTAVMNVEYWQ